MLASACSGALLIGEAGLLSNCEATIHWGYVASLAKNFPAVKVKAQQSLVLSGEAQRIVMAGGGSSWQDLALYLIGRYVGLKEAIEVAKVYVLQWHDVGQKPFSSLLGRQHTQDAASQSARNGWRRTTRRARPSAPWRICRACPSAHSSGASSRRRGCRRWTTRMPFVSKRPSKCWRQRICRSKQSRTRLATRIRASSAACSGARRG